MAAGLVRRTDVPYVMAIRCSDTLTTDAGEQRADAQIAALAARFWQRISAATQPRTRLVMVTMAPTAPAPSLRLPLPATRLDAHISTLQIKRQVSLACGSRAEMMPYACIPGHR